MAYRTFIDSDGTRWEVWAVRLQAVERRSGRERRANAHGRSESSHAPLTERRRGDRRQLHGHESPRLRVGERFAGGWLAFESPTERRRLAPIPADWLTASDRELGSLCERAIAIRTVPARGH
jgi:hypothetical protein